MVVIYRLSWPTYAIARALIRVRHIAMANLLAVRRSLGEPGAADRAAAAVLAGIAEARP
jgi:lipid A disaccharide synthetase